MEENRSCPPKQHVHEVLGSTQVSGCCDFAHSHRFATVSGEAIPCEGSHVHEVRFTTDSCNGHQHCFTGTSSKAKDVGYGRHIHVIEDCTSTDAGHKHEFLVGTLIEDPTCEEKHRPKK